MSSSHKIANFLSHEFHAKFDVTKVNSQNEEYIIKIAESYDKYFYLTVIIKDSIRLTILCEPEKYAADFVEELGRASLQKKTLFSQYWDALGSSKISIKINDAVVKKQDWFTLSDGWKKFSLKYTKAPFYDEDSAVEEDVINSTIKQIINMMLSLTDYSIIGDGYEEGAAQRVTLTKYERNPLNRELCLIKKGYKCSVCGFDFEQRYGVIGKNYIEVHHSIPVSLMEEGHIVDPLKELFPVCSNCHSMIHRKTPPYTIEEIQERIKEND